jgi:hypothetical protein
MKTGRQLNGPLQRHAQSRAGFTLLDVLVSIFVIAILIGLLLPKISHVHESARRVVCQSNVRQVGIGVMSYANDYRGFLPPSVFLPQPPNRGSATPQNMDTLRTATPMSGWDGLGYLYSLGYTNTPKVFYCPSHKGEKPFARFAPVFTMTEGEILSNYHFRGEGPTGRVGGIPTTNLDRIDPAQSSLVADGFQLRSDYNHLVGANFFRADLTVHWFPDPGSRIMSDLPNDKAEADRLIYVPDVWEEFDRFANGGQQ